MAAALALQRITGSPLSPTRTLVPLWHRLAARDTASPKVWMDAYLAAFAMNARLRLVTLDQDFKAFEAQGLDCLRVAK